MKILQGNCIEIMRGMPDASVDLCFADPPYNAKHIGPNHRTYTLGEMSLPIEDYVQFCHDWFIEAQRVAKRVLLTPGIANMCYYPQPNWSICWSKPTAVSFNRFGGFNVWEPIFIYGKIPSGNRLRRDLIQLTTKNGFGRATSIESSHPCPKPLELMRYLVTTFSHEGEVVIDPFAGSGTTLRAAKDLGRDCIGIDINPEYVELCRRRIAQEVLL